MTMNSSTVANAIEIRNLQKTYPGKPPVEAVRGIDLTVRQGTCYGVLGPNGAGKTTTIEILEGLLEPTGGDVSILGRNWKNNDQAIREDIGVSLQETKLSDKLSVAENVQLFRSFYKDGLTVEQAIEKVGLTEKSSAWVKNLSGGQKQRLAVACAIVGNPKLLFLDEPTTGLDPTNRRALWDIVRQFKQEGRTVLLTTHYMEEAEQLCDRVAIVDKGKVIAEGPPEELISSLGAEHMIEFGVDDPEKKVSLQDIESVEGVLQVKDDGDAFLLSVKQPHQVLPGLIKLAGRFDVPLTGLTTRNTTLEDVFLKLTGRHLAESDE